MMPNSNFSASMRPQLSGRTSFPQHNAILVLVVLTIPPLLVAWICGYRQPKELVTVAVLLSALTLALTVTFGKLTGVSTGMIEPILVRALAGFLAGTIAVWHAAQPRPVA
jgi:hypothetical protein